MKPSKTRENSVIAHATCMGLAFAFLMPMGAILIRVASMRHLVWYHAAIMLFAYVLALAGLGLGVYIAIEPESQVSLPRPSSAALSCSFELQMPSRIET